MLFSIKAQNGDGVKKSKKSFRQSKTLLLSSKVLVHFDPKLPVVLACDTLSYGVGVVLAYEMPDGTENPIGFASPTFTTVLV